MKITSLQYAQTLFELTAGKSQQEVSGIVSKFADQLHKDGQIKNAGMIIEKFEQLYNSKHGIVKAEIVTKYKLQDAEYKKIEDFIKARYEAESVEIISVTNEDIKGGIIIKVGDEILDGSIASQLKKLESELKK